jgi:hemolysin activation/secretion protein
VTGNVTLSNYGSSYTGYTRIGGTVNLINPLHHGDVLTLSGLSSGSDLTNYARVAYESLLNGQGSRMGGRLFGTALRPGRLAVVARWAR